jgi:hypothetical protein
MRAMMGAFEPYDSEIKKLGAKKVQRYYFLMLRFSDKLCQLLYKCKIERLNYKKNHLLLKKIKSMTLHLSFKFPRLMKKKLSYQLQISLKQSNYLNWGLLEEAYTIHIYN